MRKFVKLPFLTVLAVCLAAAVPLLAADNDVSTKVGRITVAIDRDVQELKLLSEQISKGDTSDIEALQFRKDGRSFKLIEDLDALTINVAKLPQDNANRTVAMELLTNAIETIGGAVFARLKELDDRVTAADGELASLSGGALISRQVYIHSLESVRFGYYRALIDHFDSRKTLGLSSKKLRERLKFVLYIHAEKLAGKVEYTRISLAVLQAQLDADAANSDLSTTLKNLAFQHQVAASKLKLATELLDRLDVDTSGYKAVLIKGSGNFSVDLISVDVLKSVMRDGLTSLGGALKASAPDIIFKLFVFVAIILIFRFLSRLTRGLVERSCENSSLDLSSLLKDILISGSGGTVMVFGVLVALSQIGISLGPMLAGLGVAGFVIGFALQDTLSNFAAGAMILIYRPYDVDDFVEVTGASGLVKKMNLVSTTIVTFDNQTLVVPNSKIWGDVIKNVTAQKVRRVDLEFGIGYSDDIELAERVLKDIIDSHTLILEKPEAQIKLHTLGDSSVNFIVRPWVKTEDYWAVYWDLMREVKMRFDREGISIPFPQRDIHVYSEAPMVNPGV